VSICHDSDPPSVLKEDDFGFVAGIVKSLQNFFKFTKIYKKIKDSKWN
jgi:hypothetical protein